MSIKHTALVNINGVGASQPVASANPDFRLNSKSMTVAVNLIALPGVAATLKGTLDVWCGAWVTLAPVDLSIGVNDARTKSFTLAMTDTPYADMRVTATEFTGSGTTATLFIVNGG